jgi:cytochrome c oxidase subunit 4
MAHAPTNHTKTYLKIFGALFVLTVIEVIIGSYAVGWGLPHAALYILLIALALVKAGLVAVYFMHLKYDAKFLSVIAYTPLAVASILILLVAMEWAFQPHWLF